MINCIKKNNYEQKKNSVAIATLTIALITILSKLLGFAREAVIAQEFGANNITDAFLVVFNIPYMANAILSSALVMVVVPVIVELMVAGKMREAQRLFTTIFIFTTGIVAALVLICVWQSDKVISLFAPGFSDATAQLASTLATVMFPAILFFTFTNLFTGVLNSCNIFGPPALAPVVLNIAIITSAFSLGSIYGIGGAALGVFLGTALGALLQVFFFRRSGLGFKLPLPINDPRVRKIFLLMLPIIVGSGVSQLNVIIYYIFGSGLDAGSISALNYATKLIQLPQGIFVMAVGTAIFPSLSRSVASGHISQFSQTLLKGTKLILLIAAPAVVGLMVLSNPIVELLFKRGAFDEHALVMTSGALFFLSIGMLGQCLGMVLIRGYYAMQNTVTPLIISLFTVALNVTLSLVLLETGRYLGLAIANALASTVNALLLIVFLSRKVKGIMNNEFVSFLLKITLASLIMGICVFSVDTFFSELQGSTIMLTKRLMLDISSGALVYFAIGFILKVDILGYLLNQVFGRFSKKILFLKAK